MPGPQIYLLGVAGAEKSCFASTNVCFLFVWIIWSFFFYTEIKGLHDISVANILLIDHFKNKWLLCYNVILVANYFL